MTKSTIRVTWQDGSGTAVEIENKYLPLLNDVIHRITHLQDYDTMVMQTEEDLYQEKIDYKKACGLKWSQRKNEL